MKKIKVIHFDENALNSITGLSSLVDILKHEQKAKNQSIVVLSGVRETEQQIQSLIHKAIDKKDYKEALKSFFNHPLHIPALLEEEFKIIEFKLKQLTQSSAPTSDLRQDILSISSTISIKMVIEYLESFELNAQQIPFDVLYSEEELDQPAPFKTIALRSFFKKWNFKKIPIIAQPVWSQHLHKENHTHQFSSLAIASHLTEWLSAEVLDLYSEKYGLFSAPPSWVRNAENIHELHYEEAISLSNLGWPLPLSQKIKNIAQQNTPIRLLNNIQPHLEGTVISSVLPNRKLKSIQLHEKLVALKFEFEEETSKNNLELKINSLISQHIASRHWKVHTTPLMLQYFLGQKEANLLLESLYNTLNQEGIKIKIQKNLAIISMVGADNDTHQRSLVSLIKNNINPLYSYQTQQDLASFFVVEEHKAIKGLNLIHHQLFQTAQIINLALIGHGTVGAALLQQILETKDHLAHKKGIYLNIFSLSNSQKILLNEKGIHENWKEELDASQEPQSLEKIIAFAKAHHLENLILVDNTANDTIVHQYGLFVEHGFNIVSSNKIANTLEYSSYQNLRNLLKQHQKSYLYETNVGAGLPLIDTIQLLHASGENITKIQGVFSGTLSYLFNEFSKREHSFSELLLQAQAKGFTEPDPREDLSGQDVARKLLILARELDLENEFSDIEIESLVPKALSHLNYTEFINNLAILDEHYSKLLKTLPKNKVLRYVGTLSGDLQQSKGILKTSLIQVDKNSSLGQLSGSDSFFEIYTASYGDLPIIIQGAGAGASVTARGVLGDILRIAQKQ